MFCRTKCWLHQRVCSQKTWLGWWLFCSLLNQVSGLQSVQTGVIGWQSVNVNRQISLCVVLWHLCDVCYVTCHVTGERPCRRLSRRVSCYRRASVSPCVTSRVMLQTSVRVAVCHVTCHVTGERPCRCVSRRVSCYRRASVSPCVTSRVMLQASVRVAMCDDPCPHVRWPPQAPWPRLPDERLIFGPLPRLHGRSSVLVIGHSHHQISKLYIVLLIPRTMLCGYLLFFLIQFFFIRVDDVMEIWLSLYYALVALQSVS